MKLARLGLALLFLSALATPARADRVTLATGRVLEGKVLSRDRGEIKIKLKFGIQTLPEDEVSKVEILESPLEEFERRLKGARGDAARLFELGRFAEAKDLPAQARQAFLACVEVQKDHEGARTALGQIRFEGQWVTREERLRRIKERDAAIEAKRAAEARALDPKAAEPKAEPKTEPKVAPQPEAPVPPAEGDDDFEPASEKKRARSWMDDTQGGVPWDKAYVLETPHYVIKTNVAKEHAKRYGKIMEALAERFTKIFRFAGNDFAFKKNELVLYNGQKEFMAEEQESPYVGGFYSRHTKRITTFHGTWEGSESTTLGILAHEATHQFENLVLRQMDHAPTFMIEGLATIFEATEIRDDGDVVVGKIPVDRLRTLKRAIQAKRNVPLRDVLRTPHHRFTGFHYAHAWGLIHWMLYGPEKEKAQKLLDGFWALCLERPTTAEDFEACLAKAGLSVEKTEAAWKEWVLSLDPEKDPAVLLWEQAKKARKS